MDKYSIYCIEEQARKVLKLGAPLKEHPFETSIIKTNEKLFSNLVCINDRYYCLPTAEQIINWLEEQGIVIIFMATMKEDLLGYTWIAHICHFEDKSVWVDAKNLSRKEATLAAIDAALDYLEKR